MKARLPKGMGGGAQNMQSMVKQAQKMQEEMESLQSELDLKEYEISAGGGAVNVKIKGTREIISITLKEEIVDPTDIESLQDTLVAAINEAVKKVETVNGDAMNNVTSGINVPGLF